MAPATEEIGKIEKQIADLKKKLTELRLAQPRQAVSDFEFMSADGPVKLSQLFGDKDDLLLISNMGNECPYCTLWADGMNGLVPELESRCALLLVSPDPIETVNEFSSKRGWRFNSVSDGGDFRRELGVTMESGWPYPAAVAFHREPDGQIVRVSHSEFGPGDDFCAVWPLLDLLPDGANEWQPDYRL
jgi:predicted dithiol-disulfide oxidoreductase (DUF899 family)